MRALCSASRASRSRCCLRRMRLKIILFGLLLLSGDAFARRSPKKKVEKRKRGEKRKRSRKDVRAEMRERDQAKNRARDAAADGAAADGAKAPAPARKSKKSKTDGAAPAPDDPIAEGKRRMKRSRDRGKKVSPEQAARREASREKANQRRAAIKADADAMHAAWCEGDANEHAESVLCRNWLARARGIGELTKEEPDLHEHDAMHAAYCRDDAHKEAIPCVKWNRARNRKVSPL